MYFTATFPYVLLIVLLVYGCTLDGAVDGIKELFIPKTWSGPKSIQDPQVWRKAAEQMFFSLSVSWGGLIMFGSYNKFHHKVGSVGDIELYTLECISHSSEKSDYKPN